MRPELVRNSHIPLCSDAFSSFNVENKEAFNKDIETITGILLNDIIPNVALYLSDYYQKNPLSKVSLHEELPKFVTVIHRKVNFL